MKLKTIVRLSFAGRPPTIAFWVAATLVLAAGCAEESPGVGVASERGRGARPTSAASQAAHGWCEKNPKKVSKVSASASGIWVGDDDNIWIPAEATADGDRQLMVHWDGNTLCAAELLTIKNGYWGSIVGAIDDVWAANNGEVRSIWHWDGLDWTRVQGVDGYVRDLFYLGRSDIYAVGDKIHHWDGTAWIQIKDPALGLGPFSAWFDGQQTFWVVKPQSKPTDCDVAVLSPAGSAWTASCVLHREEGQPLYFFEVAGLGKHPWFLESKSAYGAGTALYREGDDGRLSEVLVGGASVHCTILNAVGENVVCRNEEGYLAWAQGQGEPIRLDVPKHFYLSYPQGRNDFWAIAGPKVFRSADGFAWAPVVSFSKEASRLP
jgi:hypothetical protein